LWSALSAVLLMLVVVLLSLYLSLGIHKDAVVATVRYALLLHTHSFVSLF
jgi:ABC-type iron transport system FetAB permease component